MRFHLRRTGAVVALVIFSCFCVNVGFPNVGTKIRNTSLGNRIWPRPWKWGDQLEEGGVRLVVFGDSWVDDTIQDGEKGKGRSWPGVFCEKLNCSSHYNFATSQPSASFPQHAQTGVLTSNTHPDFASTSDAVESLPDLSTQIRQYITLLPTSPTPTETIFVISFGFWDIYHLAGHDFEFSNKSVDDTIKELFRQLDILYAAYREHVLNKLSESSTLGGGNIPFRVVIPNLMDPTLLPGWTGRPAPLPPASAAEEHKQAVYLTERWNTVLENGIAEWMDGDGPSRNASESESESETEKVPRDGILPRVVKDVFFYDLPMYLLNILVKHQLEAEGMVDATDSDTSFASVRSPCVRDLEEDEDRSSGFVEVNGKLVCANPNEFLFWDGFRIGAVANEGIGNAVGAMVNEGMSVRRFLGNEMPNGDL